MSNERFLTAYVDLPFLKKLFREKPEELDTPLDDDWPVVWQNVYRFLQLSANIVVDADEQDIESNQAIARFFFDGGFYHHVDPQPGVSERYTDLNSVKVDDHPYSVFLLENDAIPTKTLRECTGLAFLEFDDLKVRWSKIFQSHSLNVLPEDRLPSGTNSFEWNDLQPHAVPLNAIVIADKYAYEQFRHGHFEQNLGKLLLTLLPNELDHPIHITLVTDLEASLKNDFNQKKENWPHPKDIREDIRAHLEKNRPELNVRLGVVGYGDHGHKDRFIFTNYGLFTSNDSFSFFKKNGLNKETLVTYLPSSTQGFEVVMPRLRRMAKYLTNLGCFDASAYEFGPDEAILLADGDNKNRLLDGIKLDGVK